MFFRRKKNNDKHPFKFQFQYYDKGPKDFIIFVGSSDEEVQKSERMWVSWEMVVELLNRNISLRTLYKELEKETDAFINKQFKRGT
jgi:hypothetical protein